jgi:adenylate kinase
MIFVSGVHGVGKTYLCDILKKKFEIEAYSASQLISIQKGKQFSNDKLTHDIENNQDFLVAAVDELKEKGELFLLDGHFCLLDEKGCITRISKDVFFNMKPSLMILLTEDPKIIVERRFQRDGIRLNEKEIALFQESEILYAKEISNELKVPLEISKGTQDIDKILNLFKKGLK